MRSWLARSFAAVLAVSLWSGCSFIFVKKPAPNALAAPVVQCTSGNVAPIVDSVFTAGRLLSAVLFSVNPGLAVQATGDPNAKAAPFIIGGILGALVFGGSAYYGYTNTAKCRAIIEEKSRAVPVPPTPTSPLTPTTTPAPASVPAP